MSAFAAWSMEYLANALWQAPLLFFAARLMARGTQRAAPGLKHRIWLGALLLQPVLPALSTVPARFLWWLGNLFRLNGDAETAREGARVSVSFGDGTLHGSVGLPAGLLRGVAALYLGTLIFLALRLLWGLWRMYELLAAARGAGPEDGAGAWMLLYGERFGVPHARVVVSAAVRGPVTVGVRDRVLVLPEGFALLPEEDRRAALAHEFAHMRRQDFAKNLLYRIVSLPLAFHPATRATLAQVAETREMVCDAMAAEAVAGSTRYAKSLLRLASRFAGETPDIHLHAIGIFAFPDANTLERRITMLTTREKTFGWKHKLGLGLMAATLSVGAFSSAMAFRLHVVAGEAGGLQTPQNVHISGGVMAGQMLTKVDPVYPEDAKAAGVTGAVVLHAVIGETGTVEELKVISGPPELANSAVEAVRQWTYKPYLLNGMPTAVDTMITVNFQLNP